MPNIFVKVPEGVFDQSERDAMGAGLSEAAYLAEGIPDDPAKKQLTWVIVEEVESSGIYIAGNRLTPEVIPVVVQFFPPEGVLDDNRRQIAASEVHKALASSVPEDKAAKILSSCMIVDVPEGTWGANGSIWRLADITNVVGYTHLQHLVA